MYEVDHIYRKVIGGAGVFAKVRFRITPQSSGSGLNFVNSSGECVPAEFVLGVEKGVHETLGRRDLKVELIDGAYHIIDSSVASFEIATTQAMMKAIQDFDL